MNLKFLIPTLKSACLHAVISQELNTTGPRTGLVLAFDANNHPHVLYVEDAAHSRRPAHLASGERLPVEIKSLAATIATLDLSPAAAVDRMADTLLPSLASLLFANQSPDARMAELAATLNRHAVEGIVAATQAQSLPKPDMAAQQPERN